MTDLILVDEVVSHVATRVAGSAGVAAAIATLAATAAKVSIRNDPHLSMYRWFCGIASWCKRDVNVGGESTKTPLPPDDIWGFRGCFANPASPAGRVAGAVRSYTDAANMTEVACVGFCRRNGFTEAGVHGGTMCACGGGPLDNSHSLEGGAWVLSPRDHLECSSSCAGDNTRLCGGPENQLSVWARGAPVPGARMGEVIDDYKTGACYNDDSDKFNGTIMSTFLHPYKFEPGLTPAKCIAECADMGEPYAGLEYGNICFCDSSLSENAEKRIVPDSQCDIVCPGDSLLTCGGNDRVRVYKSIKKAAVD